MLGALAGWLSRMLPAAAMGATEADTVAGILGVPQLWRLWRRTAASATTQPATGTDWAADQAAIYGLGLGLYETLTVLLAEKPDFAAFERWVIERNGGTIDRARIAEVNAAVARARGEAASPTESGADFAPVLDEADLRCWDENGYVVLRGAARFEDCRAAARAIWEFLGMDPDLPESWYGSGKCEGLMVPLVHHPAFDRNRGSPRIRNAFAQLYGSGDLHVTIDRGGFNPPECALWAFPGPGLHWDTSLAPPLPRYYQGILYLTDTPAEQGAFQCVPGFHRRLEAWLASLPEGADPRAQDLSAEAVRVAGNAGDMVIWHGALPHGASANRGTRPRLVQYIAYHPPNQADDRPWV